MCYCKKCNINWQTLHSKDSGDQTVEFCPLCKSDMDLEDQRPGETFICDAFSHRITNYRTKEELIIPSPTPPKFIDRRSKEQFLADRENADHFFLTEDEKNEKNFEYLKQFGL